MCARFMFTSPASEVDLLLHLSSPELLPRFNVAPSNPIMVARSGPEIDFMVWGLVPAWAKDASIGQKLINARSETANEKPSYRGAMKYRRCAIPMSGFYEWVLEEASEPDPHSLFGDTRTITVKQPFLFELRSSPTFAIAGLWEIWHAPDGSELRTVALLTTGANLVMRTFHDRMPCILRAEDIDEWISDVEVPPMHALLPYAEDDITYRRVSRRLNKPGVEGADLLTA